MSLKIDMEILINGPGDQTNFTTQLLKLIFKADARNRRLLREGFPQAVAEVYHYEATGEILDLKSD